MNVKLKKLSLKLIFAFLMMFTGGITVYATCTYQQRADLNETELSVSVIGNEEIHIRDLNSVQFTCNSIIHRLCTINSSTLDVGIIASVCGLPNSPS